MIPIPFEVMLFPLLSLLMYSVALNGLPIFDDMEVIPSAKNYQFVRSRWKTGRLLSSFLLALQMRWPATLRGVHATNCWIHALNAFLVEQLAKSLGADPIHALAAGIFFIAMPFAAHTVSYMSGQANLLAATFGLLGALAIVSHHPWFSLPCLLLSYLSKEDGLGFAATFVLLTAWQAEWMATLAMAVGLAGVALHQRKWLSHLASQTGDGPMAAIGLPVSYPQPRHGLTVLVATLRRLPAWFLGLKQSPYHGSGLKK